MVLAGQVSSQTYGNFMRIDSEEHLTNWYQHRFRFFPPMHGITILEVQQKILQFLVDCCRQILHDIPFEDLTNSTFAIQPEPPAIAVAETSYTQLATIAAEAPYRVPSRLDTARLLHLIQAKRTSAEDHVWNLREDPAYFAMSLTNLAEHHPQRLPDMYGKMAPCEKSETFWSENVRLLVQNGHTSFLWWDALFHKANILHQAVAGTFEKFDPCKPLPYNVEDAICQMIRDLDDLTGFTRRHLGDAVVCSPNLGRSVVRGTAASGTGNVAALMEDDQKADYLMSLFGIVFNYREGDSGTIGFETIVNEIQHVLDRDLAQKKRLSSHALDSFSEFALVSTIASDLSNLFPWSVDFPRIVHTSIFDSAQDTTDMQKLRAALHQKEVQWDVRSVLPISTKLYYPVHKAFNASNVEAARSAEANLDTMWAIIDEHFSARTGTTLQHIFSKYATQERDIRRTLRWKAPARALLEETASDDEALPGAFSSLSMEAEKPRRFQGEIPREKLKTRSLQPQSESNCGIPAGEPFATATDSAQATQRFEVSARALKVFRTVLHTYGASSEQRGEIDWKDFLHAMSAMGFAAEKLYGSVWHFVPTQPGMKKSIHIHEPHPTSKIPFWNARAIGRRFYRTFGWTGEMFSD